MDDYPIITGLGIDLEGDFIHIFFTNGDIENVDVLFDGKIPKEYYKDFILSLISLGGKIEKEKGVDLHLRGGVQ